MEHNRTDETREILPTKVIIVEGILIFQNPTLRDMFDIKIFVETDADVRILRRALRDVEERGRTLQSVVTQYLTTVKPMHEQYVEPSKRRADIIMELQMGIMEEYNRKLTGTDLEVVVEGYDRYASSYFGRSAADAPDIDGKIFFTSKKKLAVGQYLPVHVDDVLDYDLIGSAL